MKPGENMIKKLSFAKHQFQQQAHAVPLVEIYGGNRVLVENHQGIISYDYNKILVKVNAGYIQISGDSMRISKMSRERIVVNGKIVNVNLSTGG